MLRPVRLLPPVPCARADSATRTGEDRAGSWIPDRQLLEYFVPPFEAAVRSGVATAMESYGEVNGEPVASSGRLLKGLLRQRLGFTGMLVTDWAEIENLHRFHKVAASDSDAVLLAMRQTSIDMSMVPTDDSFPRLLTGLVTGGSLPQSRLDDSVRRVLGLKVSGVTSIHGPHRYPPYPPYSDLRERACRRPS